MARTASPPRAVSLLSTDAVEQVAGSLAPLMEQDVAAQTSAPNFKRGHAYTRLGHIFRAVRRANMLRALPRLQWESR